MGFLLLNTEVVLKRVRVLNVSAAHLYPIVLCLRLLPPPEGRLLSA